MTTPGTSMLRSILEILGIVFIRFRPVQRAWGAWLVAVNSASLLFIGHLEAQVALAAVGAALLGQAMIYTRHGFVRLLGTTHVLWIPMLAWMALRLPAAQEPGFHAWLIALILTNAVSLAIDAWDAARFLRGERAPHYAW